MNVLSAVPQAPSSPSSKSGNGSASGSGDRSFAAMIDKPAAGGASARPQSQTRPSSPAERQPQARDRPDAQEGATPASAPTGDAAAAEPTRPEDGAPDTPPDWPPAGLVGLIAPPAAEAPQAAPAATQPPSGGTGTGHPAPLPGMLADAARASAAAAAEVDVPPLPSEQAGTRLALDPSALQAVDGPDAPAFVLPTAPLAPAAPGAAAPVSPPAHLPQPDLHGDAFADEVSTNLKWMADQKVGHAHIRITPHDMGPIEVRLHLDGDRISADFSAAQADVRQALEQSLPRLRDMLGQHGFQLSHAGVGHDGGQQAGGDGGRGGGPDGGDADGHDGASVTVQQVRLRGLLDAYA